MRLSSPAPPIRDWRTPRTWLTSRFTAPMEAGIAAGAGFGAVGGHSAPHRERRGGEPAAECQLGAPPGPPIWRRVVLGRGHLGPERPSLRRRGRPVAGRRSGRAPGRGPRRDGSVDPRVGPPSGRAGWRDRDATVLFFACTLWSGLLDHIRGQGAGAGARPPDHPGPLCRDAGPGPVGRRRRTGNGKERRLDSEDDQNQSGPASAFPEMRKSTTQESE